MPSSSLLLWLFTRALLLPHQPAVLSLTGPGDLPGSTSVYGLVETGVPAVTSDRFDASGAGVGQAAKLGAYGGSSTQTTYRIDGLDVTNPLRPGTPMVLPDPTGFESVAITQAADLTDESASGTRIALVSMRPTAKPTVAVQGFFTPTQWAASASQPPAIAALRSMQDGSAVWTGPLGRRAGLAAGAHWARSTHVERDRPQAQLATTAAAFAHLVVTPREHDEMRALVMLQESQHAPDNWLALGEATRARDRMGLAQLSWARSDPARLQWRADVGYQRSHLDPATTASNARMDSVLDGSVLPIAIGPAGTAGVLRASASLARRSSSHSRHDWRVGITLDQARMRPELLRTMGVDETVAGVAARAWRFDAGVSPSRWRQASTLLYATDRTSLGSRLHIETGVRVETLRASNGAEGHVNWSGVYPRIALDLRLTSSLLAFAAVSRAGMPLPPLALAFGDPNAASGQVRTWTDTNGDRVAQTSEQGALIARVGPGAGASAMSAIDTGLRRPTLTQRIFGLAVDRPRWTMAITGILRDERELLQATNTGAAYVPVTVSDAGLSYPFPPFGPLVAYDRTPASFGQDQYLLTNPAGLTSSFQGLDASLQIRSRRIVLAFGATAARTDATTTGRGFRVDENDPGVLDVGANPNALVNAAGRPFFDRGYTGKIALAMQLPGHAKLGVLTRYQDGQPFSRLAVVPGLSQGPEPVSAYARGRTRFTFIGTVDARLQKDVAIRGTHLVLLLDVFDLLNSTREVEEFVATNPTFRNISAVEPPRSARLGLRLSF